MPRTIRSMHWKTCFAMSKPIVVACSMDASFGGSSTPPPWHTMPSGGVYPITQGGRSCRSNGFGRYRNQSGPLPLSSEAPVLQATAPDD